MTSFVAIIPARYASTRFPGKPLADISGKPMIQRVYERVKTLTDNVLVATDDHRIEHAVRIFKGNVVMTSDQHRSGTDRCAEALDQWEEMTSEKFDVVINIQGDEPFIRSDQIEAVKACFSDEETQIATLIKTIDETGVIFDPNRPKVVIDLEGYALYFSRSPVPYIRDCQKEQWHVNHRIFQHIGLYAYRSQILRTITSMPQSPLELAESLEQLRWLENGFRIKTAVTRFESYGIDTPEDLQRVMKMGLL
jgi:3-deoxy-manno-octulosonate cytidylyltransferase (CMP-KDO synthetase)